MVVIKRALEIQYWKISTFIKTHDIFTSRNFTLYFSSQHWLMHSTMLRTWYSITVNTRDTKWVQLPIFNELKWSQLREIKWRSRDTRLLPQRADWDTDTSSRHSAQHENMQSFKISFIQGWGGVNSVLPKSFPSTIIATTVQHRITERNSIFFKKACMNWSNDLYNRQ